MRYTFDDVMEDINDALGGDLSKLPKGTCDHCCGEGHTDNEEKIIPTFLFYLTYKNMHPMRVGACCYDLSLEMDDAIGRDRS